MSDVPKCRLCVGIPTTSPTPWGGAVVHTCSSTHCAIYGIWFTTDQWRALMAPPGVTDAMVERGAAIDDAWSEYNIAKMRRVDLTRAVLEAALKRESPRALKTFAVAAAPARRPGYEQD